MQSDFFFFLQQKSFESESEELNKKRKEDFLTAFTTAIKTDSKKSIRMPSNEGKVHEDNI